MEAQQDFKELLALFNVLHVKYIIVGGYALAFHGAPRMTGDIDILVQPNEDNAFKVLEALKKFGFGGLGLRVEDFSQIKSLDYNSRKVQFISKIPAVLWEKS